MTKKSQKRYFFPNPELNDHLSGKKPFSQNHKGILQFWSLKRSSAKGVPFAHFHRFRHNSTARCYSSCGKRFQKKAPKHGLVSWNYDFKRVEKEDFRDPLQVLCFPFFAEENCRSAPRNLPAVEVDVQRNATSAALM